MKRQSESVFKLLKSSREVEDSVATNGGDVGARLDERFTPGGANRLMTESPVGEASAPSFPDTLFTLNDGLAASRRRLAAADRQHVENLRRFLEVRRGAKKLNGSVYAKLGATRRTIEEIFKEGGDPFELAGFESPTSLETAKLLQQADLAIGRLKSPDLKLPKSLVKGIKVEPETIVSELEPEIEQLRDADGKLRLARRAVQKSRKHKNEVLAEHKNLFLWTARTFENLYLLAGEPKLAGEIRPSGRRPGRRAAEVAEEEAAGQESSDKPASDETPAGEAPQATQSPSPDSASATTSA